MNKNFSYLISNLGRRFRKDLIITSLLTFLGLFLEFISVAILLPIANLVMDSSKMVTIKDKIFYFSDFKLDDLEIYLLLILSVLIIYSLRVLVLFFIYLFQNRFIQKLHKRIFLKIYYSFLNTEVLKFKELDSEKLINILQKDLERFSAYIRDYLYLIVEFLIITILFSILLINDPIGTFFIVLMTVPFLYIFAIYLNKRMKIWGEKNVLFNQLETKIIINSLSFFKEIKIYDLKNSFINKVEGYLIKHIDVWIKQGTLSQMTRFIIETYFIFVIVFNSIFSYLVLNQKLNEILVNITILFIIIIKFLPSLSKLINYANNLKYNLESFNLISNELKKTNNSNIDSKKKHENLNLSINYDKISFNYKKQKSLLKIDYLEFKKGERILIEGKSGSGKTTLLEIILGLIKPKNTQIKIDNKNKIKNLFSSLNIGYVKQENVLIYDSIIKNIVLNETKIDYQRYILAKKISCITQDSELSDDKKVIKNINQKLSGGQKQRVAIARAIYFGKDVLIFDEATNSLDRKTEEFIFKEILKLNKQIFIYTTHSEKNYKYASRKIKV